MLKVEFARNTHELLLEKAHLLGGHRIRIDAGPHRMSMAATFFFMKDNGARLAFESEVFFDAAYGFFKIIDRYARVSRRAERQREKILATLRAFADRFHFSESAM